MHAGIIPAKYPLKKIVVCMQAAFVIKSGAFMFVSKSHAFVMSPRSSSAPYAVSNAARTG